MIDEDRCYRIACGRDGRFDGTFVTAVLTTGIYCRPSCPAVTPRRENVHFYPTPAAAQEAGFRACKRCRPDAAPGSPEWDLRADLVARAVRLIGDGVIDREGVAGLAARLGYTPRQVHRLVRADLGTGPLRLAMAQRVQSARSLLENTDLPVTEVAWASGFSSIRQFNDRIQATYALTPSQLRAARPAPAPSTTQPAPTTTQPALTTQPAPTTRPAPATTRPAPAPAAAGPVIPVRLTYRPPLDLERLLAFLGRRAVPGVESYDGSTYRAVLRLPRGLAVATVVGATGGRRPAVECLLRLDDVRDHAAAVSRLRRLLDLDADPVAVAGVLADDPLLGPSVRARPGLRMPGCGDPQELALRAVLGQNVTVAAARRIAGRIAAQLGQPLAVPDGGLRVAFPTPAAVAGADPGTFPLPRRRAEALGHLGRALSDGQLTLDPGSDRDRAERALVGLAGIGPWTAAYIRMRGLGDPDVFLPGDVALTRALEAAAAGAPAAPGGAPATPAPSETWKPWRSYAVAHLWASREEHPR